MANITVKNKVLLGGVHNMTSPYGMRTHPVTGVRKLHEGIDLVGKNGADFVVAFAAGRVSRTGYDNSAGYFVKVDHSGGAQTVYFHLKSGTIKVREGASVKAGDTLAVMGASGQVTGVHLHFGIKLGSTYVDPRPFLEGKTQLPGTAKPSPTKATSIKAGDKVRVKSGVKSYEGESVASFVYAGTYTVDALSGDRAVLDKKGICTAFKASDLTLVTAAAPAKPTPAKSAAATILNVGDRVIILPDAKIYSRSVTSIPNQYKNKAYTVLRVGNDDILLKELYSWVKKCNVRKVCHETT